jgi:hypothetical protein
MQIDYLKKCRFGRKALTVEATADHFMAAHAEGMLGGPESCLEDGPSSVVDGRERDRDGPRLARDRPSHCALPG